MAPTAKSPPCRSSEVLNETAIALSVNCMMKGETPRARQGSTTAGFTLKYRRRSRR